MAVDHLTIRRYKINIRPENFRPMIFQWFGEGPIWLSAKCLTPRAYDKRPLIASLIYVTQSVIAAGNLKFIPFHFSPWMDSASKSF